MQKGINDSMEACLILICIGIMVAVWILSGTVPTMIYYGLEVVTPQLFLPVCFLATLVIGIIVGSWGAAGTIGLAFIGIAAALGVPLGMAAGAIIAAAYVSEIVSPLVDGPNLAAAIADVDVFALCKRFLPLVIIVCLACAASMPLLALAWMCPAMSNRPLRRFWPVCKTLTHRPRDAPFRWW